MKGTHPPLLMQIDHSSDELKASGCDDCSSCEEAVRWVSELTFDIQLTVVGFQVDAMPTVALVNIRRTKPV